MKSLSDPVDTTTSHGRLIFNLFASLAEFERDVIRERTNAGWSRREFAAAPEGVRKGWGTVPNRLPAPPRRCIAKAS